MQRSLFPFIHFKRYGFDPFSTKMEKNIHIVVSYSKTYFARHLSNSTHKYSEVDLKAMLEFLIYNIFVVFEHQFFLWAQIVPPC